MKGIAMNVFEIALMFGCGYACRDAIAKHKLKVLEKELLAMTAGVRGYVAKLEKEVRQLKQQIKKGN
jgi:hypothetical protein